MTWTACARRCATPCPATYPPTVLKTINYAGILFPGYPAPSVIGNRLYRPELIGGIANAIHYALQSWPNSLDFMSYRSIRVVLYPSATTTIPTQTWTDPSIRHLRQIVMSATCCDDVRVRRAKPVARGVWMELRLFHSSPSEGQGATTVEESSAEELCPTLLETTDDCALQES